MAEWANDYKELKYCGKCGNRFQVTHHLQIYCPDCRGILVRRPTGGRKKAAIMEA